jgi:hypothetical protein
VLEVVAYVLAVVLAAAASLSIVVGTLIYLTGERPDGGSEEDR